MAHPLRLTLIAAWRCLQASAFAAYMVGVGYGLPIALHLLFGKN